MEKGMSMAAGQTPVQKYWYVKDYGLILFAGSVSPVQRTFLTVYL